MEGVGMAGAPISSFACASIIVAVNLFFLSRHAPSMLPTFRESVALYGAPALLASAAVSAVKCLRNGVGWTRITPFTALCTVGCVAVLYGAGALGLLFAAKGRKGKIFHIDK
jgi:hypothetical protein